MNICLTTECNNHCPFCFQKEMHGQKQELSAANLLKILDWSHDDLINYQEGISLLGGEPTQYKELEWVINTIYKKFGQDFSLTIITNLLCDESVINMFNRYDKLGYLINTTYDIDKEDIFLRNFIKLNQKEQLSLSITLMDNMSLNKLYIDRVVNLAERFNISSIRVGLCCPSIDDKWENIYNYEADLLYIANKVQNKRLLTFDCPVNYCQVSKEFYRYLVENYNVKGLKTVCNMPPFDILPDLSTKYCYSSSNNFRVDNIFTYKSFKELQNYFINLGMDDYIPQNKKCNNCELFLQRICHPCHSVDEALIRGVGIQKEEI